MTKQRQEKKIALLMEINVEMLKFEDAYRDQKLVPVPMGFLAYWKRAVDSVIQLERIEEEAPYV